MRGTPRLCIPGKESIGRFVSSFSQWITCEIMRLITFLALRLYQSLAWRKSLFRFRVVTQSNNKSRSIQKESRTITCGMKSLSAYVKALKSNLKKAKRMNLTTQADLYSPRSRIFRDAVIMFALREIRGFWTQDYKVLILNITFKGHPSKKPSFDDLLEYEKAMNIAAC